MESTASARENRIAEFVSGGNLVLFNGAIKTLETAQPEVEAVVIRAGRIIFLGSSKQALDLAEPDSCQVIDLGRRNALPGFIDSHVHFWRSGLMDQMIDLRPTRRIAELQAAVAEQAARGAEGSLVMGRGWADTNLAEQRYPTRWELDQAAPNHIVYLLHLNGHSCALNSRAIEFLKLDATRPGVERDQKTGVPAGPLREKVAFEAQGRLLTLMDPGVRARCLELTSQEAVKGGVTTVHCLEGGRLIGDPDVRDFLAHQAELPLSTILYYQMTDLDKVLRLGLPRIGGCVLIDGSPAAHTGALYEPYADRPDTSGPEYFTQQELNDWVLRCHRAGLQVVVHATCERAIGQMLAAYENALVQFPRAGHRHRIDHFYFPRKEQVWKAAQLGVLAGVQPYFAEFFREMYEKRLGAERVRRVHPYRWFFDAGAVAGGGSDSFVTPIRPIWGIHAAVNHFIAEQRVTVDEAVRMFTRNNAYLGFEEDDAGSLRVGKRGDLTVLSDDLYGVSPQHIKNVRVEMVISRGRVTYRP
ncbi:MAG TPA: amidohydrolase [Candidatus Acidoferrales bacterium]|nr:amidohydrolase [Candidatus Acidoferrales bacterium]